MLGNLDHSKGIPPQKLEVFMDTGSDLVWVPCTENSSKPSFECIMCEIQTSPHSQPFSLIQAGVNSAALIHALPFTTQITPKISAPWQDAHLKVLTWSPAWTPIQHFIMPMGMAA